MTFGERMKRLRLEHNLTQEELANKLSLSKSNISKYESNDVEPNIQTLHALSELFDVSLDYLLGKTDSKELYELKDKKIPAELREIGVEYMTVAKRIKEEGLTPQEIETMIEAIKKIKNDNQ